MGNNVVPPLTEPVQDPVVDPVRRERMLRFVKARADAERRPILDDRNRVLREELSEMESLKWALAALPTYIKDNPEHRDAVRAYFDGATDDLPPNWIPYQGVVPSAETQRQEFLTQHVKENRERSPVSAAAWDYVVDPVSRFYGGVGQAVYDVATGLANIPLNMMGGDIPSVDVRAAFMAAAQQLTGQGAGAFGETYDLTKEGLGVIAETGGAGSGILRGAGDVMGYVRGLALGGTAKGGAVFGSPASVLRAGGVVGAAAGKVAAIVTRMPAAGKLAGFTERVGQGMGAFGALGAVTARGEDGGAPTAGDRWEAAKHEALVGAVIGAGAEAGKAIVRGLFKTKLGDLSKAEGDVLTAIKDWAVKNKVTPIRHETAERFQERVAKMWVDAGAQGVAIPFGLRGARLAIRGGSEAFGMSLLDEQFRANLLDAWNKEPGAAAKVIEQFAATALGLAAAHGKVTDLPGLQRRMPTDRGEAKVEEAPQEPGAPPADRGDATPEQRAKALENMAMRQRDQAKLPTEDPSRARLLAGLRAQIEARNPVPAKGGGGLQAGVIRPDFQQPQVQPAGDAVPAAWGNLERQGWRPVPILTREVTDLRSPLTRAGYEVAGMDHGTVTIRKTDGLGETRTLSEREFYDEFGKAKPEAVEAGPDRVDYNRDDTAREWYATQAREFTGEPRAVPVGANVAEVALQFVPQKSPAHAKLKAIVDSGKRANVTFTAEEARRFIDYQARSAPRRRAKNVAVEQPKISAIDSLSRKLVEAFGRPAEPPTGDQRGDAGPKKPSPPIGEPVTGDAPREPERREGPQDRVEGEFPGTGLDFEIRDGQAFASPKLQDALGTSEPIPVEQFFDVLGQMSALSGLQGMRLLPGQTVSVEGPIKATAGEGDAPGKLRRITPDGRVQEAEFSPDPVWKGVESFPARGADAIDPLQAQAAEALVDVLNNRTDLDQPSRVVLGGVIDVLKTVDAKNEASVAETMAVMPEILPALAGADPVQAGKLVKALAESLTTKHPEVAIEDLARAQEAQRADTVREFAESVTKEKIGQRRVMATLRTAQGFNGEPRARGLEIERLVNEEGASVVTGKEGRRLQKPGGNFFAEKDITKTGMDYADFLAKRKAAGEKRETEPPAGEARAYGGIPVPREVVEIAKGGVKGAGEVGGTLWNKFQRQLVREVEDAGVPEIPKMAREAVKETKLFLGRHEQAGLYDLKRIPRKDMSALAHDMVVDPNNPNVGMPRGAVIMDEPAARALGEQKVKNDAEQKVIDAWRGVFLEGGRIAEELGVEDKQGRPFKFDPERRRLVRELTDEGQAAMIGRRGPLYEAVIADLQQRYGLERADVERKFSDSLALSKLDATEVKRAFPFIASHYKIGGRWVALYETDPVLHAERMAHSNAHVMGARSALPKKTAEKVEGPDAEVDPLQPPLPEAAQQLVNKVNKEQGPIAAKSTARLMRVLHGMSVEGHAPPLGLQPGSYGYHLMRVVNGFLGLNKSAALSAAAISNIGEPVANAPYLGGIGAVLKSYGNVKQAFVEGRAAEMHREAVTEGWLADSKENSPLKGDSPIETFENGLKKAGDLLTTPLRITQAGNELVLYDSAKARLSAMKDGRGDNGDLALLKAMGFAEGEARAMIAGRGTEADYNRYKTSAVSTMAGGRSAHGAEKSVAAHSRGFNALVWFTNFFQFRAQLVDSLVRDIKQSSGEDRTAKMAQLVKVAGFTAASGALIQMLREFFKNGVDGPADYIRESVNGADGGEIGVNVAKSGLELLSSGVLGGLGQPILDALGAVDSSGSVVDATKDALYRLVGPASAGVKFVDFLRATAGADVPGYENKDLLGKVAQYGRNVAPAAKMIHEGLFGISALAFASDNPELDAALDSMTRWRRDNGRIDSGGTALLAESREYRDAMRAVVNKVRDGQFYGDEELMEAIVAAQIAHVDQTIASGITEPGAFQKARQAVAASLRAMRSMPSDRDRTMTPELRASLSAHLGEKNEATLVDYDFILDLLANRISPPSR